MEEEKKKKIEQLMHEENEEKRKILEDELKEIIDNEIKEKYKPDIIKQVVNVVKKVSYKFYYNKYDQLKIDDNCIIKLLDRAELIEKIDTDPTIKDNSIHFRVIVDGKEYDAKFCCNSVDYYIKKKINAEGIKKEIYEEKSIDDACPYIINMLDFTRKDFINPDDDEAYIEFVAYKK